MVKRRRLQTNTEGIAHARFYASLLNGLGGKDSSLKPEDFLPYKLEDDNSPKAKLRKSIGMSTLKLTKRLIDEDVIPGEVLCVLYNIPNLIELLEETK